MSLRLGRPGRFALGLTAVLLAVPTIAGAPFLEEVRGTDAALGAELSIIQGTFAYQDANGNGRLDSSSPLEPVYLDVDNTNSVSYGDLRLTPFGSYAGSTMVGVPDTDVGRPLADSQGWMARHAGGWVLDTDNTLSITPGDIAFPNGSPTRVTSNDPLLGTTLSLPASGTRILGRTADSMIVIDNDPNTAGQGKLSAGDLRIQAVNTAPVTDTDDGSDGGNDQDDDGVIDVPNDASSSGNGLGGLGIVLLLLSLVNLAGLVYVIYAQRSQRPPRNPFK